VFSCSKIEQKQLNTWVSFQSAEQPLLGQFSVSGNTQVLLLDLCKRDEYTQDLFAQEQPARTEKLMSTLDAINGRWGALNHRTKPS
jgi:hypothetical protein